MIVEFFINLAVSFFSFLVGLLPVLDLPEISVNSAITTLVDMIEAVDVFVDTEAVKNVILGYLAFYILLLIIYMIRFTIRAFRLQF